jgi:raffinose/stachyose/melibiose transport system permease protein
MRRKYNSWTSGFAFVVFMVIFVLPFIFVVLTAAKNQQQSAVLSFSWPTEWRFFQNLNDVIQARDGIVITAFINSTIITVCSVTFMTVLAAMMAFVMQRRKNKLTAAINIVLLSGLIIPPAVVPTIYVMQKLDLFKTLHVLLFQAFMSTIPRELDEAAIIDGAGPMTLFFRIVLPLLRPIIITVVVIQTVFVWNDFQSALYFLPGDKNATVQLTLYNFQSQYNTSTNLLFMDILLITVPPLIMFMFFQKQIVAGMTAGSVKG